MSPQRFPRKDRNDFAIDSHYAMNGAIIAYDEGMINSDRELAAALWRTFFQKQCSDYRKLEVLVHYVRVQVSGFLFWVLFISRDLHLLLLFLIHHPTSHQLQHLATFKNEDFFDKHFEWKEFNFPKLDK